MSKRGGFSQGWIIASMFIFLAVELFLGGFVAQVIQGRFITHIMTLKIEVFLTVGSYLVGGFLIGFMSPSVKVFEPAAGAALAVLLTFCISFFTPYRFLSFAHDRALIGGAIAFVLAIAGADLGERFAAKLGNRESREYVRKTGAE